MPTYEYECPKGHTQDDFQPMPGQRTQKCRICGKRARKKIGPGAGVIFKGAGFYCNDYPKEVKPSKA